MGSEWVPPVIYLQNEREWVNEKLKQAIGLDGMILRIDWENREITSIRYAEDD